MDKQHFNVTYRGPALTNAEMDVRDLAPALLALSGLLESATEALFPGRASAQVKVCGFRDGSFGIDVSIGTSIVSRMREFFASSDASALANALAVLTALGFIAEKGRTSLIGTLRWIRNRKVERMEHADGKAVLEVDGERYEIPEDVYRLMQDKRVRNCLQKLLDPLAHPGIEVVSFGSDGNVAAIITSDEAIWFTGLPHVDTMIRQETQEMTLSFLAINFRPEFHWWAFDGHMLVPVMIEDEEFRHRVDHNLISFARCDRFRCDVRATQWRTAFGVKTEYEVVKVCAHMSAFGSADWPPLAWPGKDLFGDRREKETSTEMA